MIYSHIAAVLIGAAVAFGGAWQVQNWRYGEQIATMQKEAAEATTRAVEAAMVKTNEDQKRKDDALNKANIELQKLAKAAADSKRATDGLRDQLTAAKASLSSRTFEAVRKYAEITGDVLGVCSERYRELAKTTDQCVTELNMLEEAWPN